MKKTYILTLLAITVITYVSGQSNSKETKRKLFENNFHARTSSAFTYTLTTLTQPYSDLTGATSLNNGEIWDDPDYLIPVPFPFVLLGSDVSVLEFYGAGATLRSTTEDPFVDAYVFPFEVDLIDRGELEGDESLSPISYKVEGSAGSHILKVEWKNAGSYNELDENGTLDMFVNFQLWLFEGSNKIEFHIGPSLINDPDAFYFGETGPAGGLANYNETDDIITNPHFMAGSVSNPMLSMNIGYMSGTPADETVYRLSLDEPLVVSVTGENGTSFCMPDGTATADVTGGLEPYSYSWSNGGNTSTISNLAAGTYTVTVTDANSSTATGNVVITSPSPIIVNAESTDESFFNGHDGTASAFPTGGTSPYSYLWSNGSNQSMISGLAPGVYTVTVTDQSDCTSAQSVTVNAFGCPEITLESSIQNASCFGLCDGSITIVHVFGGSAPFNYDWGSLGGTTASVSGLCIGNYSVTITDNNGCIVIGSFEITQPELLLANAGSTNETISGQNDGTAWATPSGGTIPYLYHWNTGSTDSLIINLSPGSYTVTVTDNNLCTATGIVIVDSASCTLVPEIVNNLCFQNCDGSIEITLLNAVSPVSYIWSSGSSESSIDSLCSASYSVTATDALGCIVSATYTVTEPPQLSANAASSNQSAPGFNDGAAWAVPSGGAPPYLYNWSNGSTDSLITNLTIGLYTVTVTDDNGCADIQSVLVEGFPCAGIIESGQSDITCFNDCDGSAGVAVIGGIGPTTYLWNTGDTTSYIENLCPGTYSITINDEGQNCMSLHVFEISQPNELTVNVDQVINITDSTSASISVSVQGGVLPYLFFWTGPNDFTDTIEDLSDIEPGLYNLLVIDANGCVTTTDSIEVIDETVGISITPKLNVRVYPNPARDQLFIDLTEDLQYLIQLMSMEGKLVAQWNDAKVLNVAAIIPGSYILKITSNDKVFIKRLIITR